MPDRIDTKAVLERNRMIRDGIGPKVTIVGGTRYTEIFAETWDALAQEIADSETAERLRKAAYECLRAEGFDPDEMVPATAQLIDDGTLPLGPNGRE